MINRLLQCHRSPLGPGYGKGCLVELGAHSGYIAIMDELVSIFQANNGRLQSCDSLHTGISPPL